MKIKALILLAFIVMVTSCSNEKGKSVYGKFMGMEPTSTPVLLNPELIASSFTEYNGTFTPDGKEFFYTTQSPGKGFITYTKQDENGIWAEPTIASFSGEYSEYDPIFSPDGKRLYFTSERPKSKNEEGGKSNIWYVEKVEDSWSTANLVELEKDGVYYSSLTSDNVMYCNIWDTGDMYKIDLNDDRPELIILDTIVNSQNREGDPFISPDQDYLIYRGYNNSLGNGDLYISYHVDGKWTTPQNLGEPINSSAHEMCPYVTTDGKFFIWASGRLSEDFDANANDKLDDLIDKYQTSDNGNLNIYYISADFIDELRPK